MSWIHRLGRAIRTLPRREALEREMDEEMRSHVEMETEELMRTRGMSPEEARRQALIAFGGVERYKEEARDVRGLPLDHLRRDVRQACRQVRRSPVSTVIIVLSLAVGIGATTAIFSLADQALLRALPIDEPDELVLLDWNGRFVGGGVGSGNLLPHPFFQDLRAENDVFANVFARHPTDVHLSTGERSEPVRASIVSGSYFSTLGVQPAIGRLLDEADDRQPGAHPVVVLSHDYWRTRFGGNPEIVGQGVRVNGFPMTVVGVAQPGFRGVDWSDVPALWMPTMMQREAFAGWEILADRRTRWLHVFGRLKPGISREQAEVQLQPWFKAYLRADTEREGWPAQTDQQMNEYFVSHLDVLPAAGGRANLRGQIERPMLILLAATGLVLLLACLNVANLSLATTLARRRASALRSALGASRLRIVTEHLVESAMLAAAGCAIGVLLAPSISRAILSFLTEQGGALSAALDLRMLLFALGITILTTILFGVAPAFYAASVRPVNALKDQSSSVTGGLRVRKTLIVGQFALALVLLIGAGLFARTLGGLRAQGAGFPTTNLLMFSVAPLADGYQLAETKPLIRRLQAEIEALPEVERVGVSRFEIVTPGSWNSTLTAEASRRVVTDNIPLNAVSPDFFEALGVPVTRGRSFNEHDAIDDSETQEVRRSAIVNEEFVTRYIPDADPIGARLGFGDQPETVTDIVIVGVVANYQNRSLREPEGEVFFPLWESMFAGVTLHVRARISSDTATPAIQAAVNRIDPTLTVRSLRTLDDQLDRRLVNERLLAILAAAFALIATFLAMIGLYGVLASLAASRTKEIGIRLALGASQWSSGGMIVREAARLAVLALAIALPASWALGRLIENQLFGVRPMDPATTVAAAAALGVVCLVASAIPARKAVSVSPLEVLRTE